MYSHPPKAVSPANFGEHTNHNRHFAAGASRNIMREQGLSHSIKFQLAPFSELKIMSGNLQMYIYIMVESPVGKFPIIKQQLRIELASLPYLYHCNGVLLLGLSFHLNNHGHCSCPIRRQYHRQRCSLLHRALRNCEQQFLRFLRNDSHTYVLQIPISQTPPFTNSSISSYKLLPNPSRYSIRMSTLRTI